MTNEEITKANELLNPKDIADFAERLCEKHGFYPEKKYPQTADSAVVQSGARRLLYVGKMVNLLRRAIFLGATEVEVRNLAEHLVVMMASVEKKLNYKQSYIDHGIDALEKKYCVADFLGMTTQISFDELASVIERDREYYGVKLK